MEKIKILNISLNNVCVKYLLDNLKKGVFLTPNIDHLVKLQNDKDFFLIYQNAEWVVCDSKLLYLCSKFLPKSILEPIPGSTFFTKYCDYHKHNLNIKIFLLGSTNDNAILAMQNINQRINRNIIVGAHSPTIGFEKNNDECNEIIHLINASGANVLVVGVGAPKQEKWISRYRFDLNSIDLFMALGATIDFEAGSIRRAPLIFQTLYMEWFYRLINEPKRLWKRYLVDDLLFFSLLFKQVRNKYHDPF